MFIRKNKNRSGSLSIQIVQKVNRKNKVIKTIGIAKTNREKEILEPKIRPELLKELKSIRKEPYFEYDSVEDLRKEIENDL